MAQFNRILITGAAGSLGGMLRQELAGLANIVRLTDRLEITNPSGNEEIVICDLSDKDAVLELTKDVDAVVHLGGVCGEGSFDDILQSNIVGFYNIYEGCRKNGVKRVVWSSSVHAVGFHPRTDILDTNVRPRPDSNYGVSKVFGEAVAQYYWDQYNIESVSVRIYSAFKEPSDRRQLTTWLSFKDCAQLFQRSLLAPVVKHTVIYGVSNNTFKAVDNTLASHIGYEPVDNGEVFRDKVEAATEPFDVNDPFVAVHGGAFASAPHFDD